MTNRSEGLRGNEFQTYFNKFPHILQSFSGVCAIDELPQNIAIRHFLVFNLSEKHLAGSHWAIILRSSVNQIEVFNSLGQNNVDYLMPYLKFKNLLQLILMKRQFKVFPVITVVFSQSIL